MWFDISRAAHLNSAPRNDSTIEISITNGSIVSQYRCSRKGCRFSLEFQNSKQTYKVPKGCLQPMGWAGGEGLTHAKGVYALSAIKKAPNLISCNSVSINKKKYNQCRCQVPYTVAVVVSSAKFNITSDYIKEHGIFSSWQALLTN